MIDYLLSTQSLHMSKEWQSRATEWRATVQMEAQKERSRTEAFERKIADLEQGKDQLQQESYVGFLSSILHPSFFIPFLPSTLTTLPILTLPYACTHHPLLMFTAHASAKSCD